MTKEEQLTAVKGLPENLYKTSYFIALLDFEIKMSMKLKTNN